MSEDKAPVVTGRKLDGKLDGSGTSVIDPPDYPLTAIEDAVRSIRYGTVQIVIQDGRIVQIEKTEKIRLR